jgi:hypothetical protein
MTSDRDVLVQQAFLLQTHVQLEAMKAANAAKAWNGEAPVYQGEDFDQLHNSINQIIENLRNL